MIILFRMKKEVDDTTIKDERNIFRLKKKITDNIFKLKKNIQQLKIE